MLPSRADGVGALRPRLVRVTVRVRVRVRVRARASLLERVECLHQRELVELAWLG